LFHFKKLVGCTIGKRYHHVAHDEYNCNFRYQFKYLPTNGTTFAFKHYIDGVASMGRKGNCQDNSVS